MLEWVYCEGSRAADSYWRLQTSSNGDSFGVCWEVTDGVVLGRLWRADTAAVREFSSLDEAKTVLAALAALEMS